MAIDVDGMGQSRTPDPLLIVGPSSPTAGAGEKMKMADTNRVSHQRVKLRSDKFNAAPGESEITTSTGQRQNASIQSRMMIALLCIEMLCLQQKRGAKRTLQSTK